MDEKQTNNAKQKKKQNYLHPFTGIRNHKTIQRPLPRPNPSVRITPRHDLAVSRKLVEKE
jgi:hypothetical protein